MKIFHAIDNADIVPLFFNKTGVKINTMISYAYLEGNAYKLTRTYRDFIDLLYLDSGAFSSYAGKYRVSILEYGRYLKRYGKFFDEVVTLDDSLDDPDHNFNNLTYLEEVLEGSVKKPIPVIHDPEDPFREIETYIALGYTYIALGSMGRHKRIDPIIIERVKQEYPNIKLHLFGNLNFDVLQTYRPYSADSSTWALQGGMSGSIYYWQESEKKVHSFHVGEKKTEGAKKRHIKKFSLWKEEVEPFLWNTFKFRHEDLLTSSYVKQIVNLYFFKQFEDYVNSLAVN